MRGPTFMNVCGWPLGVDVNRDDELVVPERIPLHADEELVERHAPRAADAGHLDLGALDEQRRQGISRR